MTSLRLSIRYGGGNLHFFDELPHEDQVNLMALEREENDAAAARARAAERRNRRR